MPDRMFAQKVIHNMLYITLKTHWGKDVNKFAAKLRRCVSCVYFAKFHLQKYNINHFFPECIFQPSDSN